MLRGDFRTKHRVKLGKPSQPLYLNISAPETRDLEQLHRPASEAAHSDSVASRHSANTALVVLSPIRVSELRLTILINISKIPLRRILLGRGFHIPLSPLRSDRELGRRQSIERRVDTARRGIGYVPGLSRYPRCSVAPLQKNPSPSSFLRSGRHPWGGATRRRIGCVPGTSCYPRCSVAPLQKNPSLSSCCLS